MRQETTTRTLYQYDELSEKAKAKARDWYREDALDYEWWDSIYEDAFRAGLTITSFDLDRHKGVAGKLTMSLVDSCKAILANHGTNCNTYKLAKDTLVTWEGSEKTDEVEEVLTEEYTYALREEYALILQKEYEYLLSDEAVEDNIKANEYEFTESGHIA